jgi:hypothetical protein
MNEEITIIETDPLTETFEANNRPRKFRREAIWNEQLDAQYNDDQKQGIRDFAHYLKRKSLEALHVAAKVRAIGDTRYVSEYGTGRKRHSY